MTGLPLTLRRWTRHEYERLVNLGLFQRDPVNLVDRVLEVYRDPVPDASAPYGWRYRSVQILTPPAAIAPLAMPFTPILVAELLP